MYLQKIVIFLFSTLLLGCGVSGHLYEETLPEDIPRVAEAETIQDQFEERWRYYNGVNTFFGYSFGPNDVAARFQDGKIHLGFKDLQSTGFSASTTGVCWYRGDGSRDVEFDREYWDKLTALQKRWIVFHEVGHCQLSREHRCSKIDSTNKLSYMYPYVLSNFYLANGIYPLTGYYGDMTANYMELELFSRSNQGVNDCLTSGFQKEEPDQTGDIAHPVSLE